MIKANEFRIGNLITDRTYQILIVDVVSSGGCKVNGRVSFHYENMIEGIPLTPEILEKAGFKFKNCGISGADMWQGMAFWKHENLNLRGNVSTVRGGILHPEGYFNTQIQYVHQLQNLYFALTGEELPTAQVCDATGAKS